MITICTQMIQTQQCLAAHCCEQPEPTKMMATSKTEWFPRMSHSLQMIFFLIQLCLPEMWWYPERSRPQPKIKNALIWWPCVANKKISNNVYLEYYDYFCHFSFFVHIMAQSSAVCHSSRNAMSWMRLLWHRKTLSNNGLSSVNRIASSRQNGSISF